MRLFSFEIRWMERWFRSILPLEGDTYLPGAESLPIDAFIRDFFSHTPVGSAIGVRLASNLVTVLFFLRYGRRPFRQSRDVRNAWLQRLGDSRVYILRELPMLLKLTAFMAWDAQHSVHRALGVTGDLGRPAVWLHKEEQA